MLKQRDREAQLQSLEEFSKATANQLNDIVSTLGWSMNDITHGKITICCPFDPAHRVPEDRLEKHLESCQWTAEGYQKQDVPLSYPSLRPCAPSSITFDEKLQDEVLSRAKIENPSLNIGVGGRLIPRTSNRLQADFTSDERKALYDYVIGNTRKPEIGEDIADINKPKAQDGETKKNTFLELLAQERNLKRRRAKHRGVHTNKKSHLEIMREVIEQQMEMFIEYLTEQQDSLIPNNVVHSSHTKSVNQLAKLNGNNWNSTATSSKEVESKRDYTRLQERDIPTEHRRSRYDETKGTQDRISSDRNVRSRDRRSSSRTRKDRSNTGSKDHHSRDRGSHFSKDKYHKRENRRHESSRSRRHSREHDRERHGNSSKREERHSRNKNFPMYGW
ncbi:U11/U12 small nuclear ribonucleoprotein 48 kDa protein [Cephus cinctus]|uniref:U11/U12 small nuclear ribonucleoprotein 48 kDa protein n=1 Tax=Cephus cinctus TaxID=211228 RepID=A0AAJ7C9S2_CEPCN|nr:U11/U12 small nuclear ribonucleoprotein 48 kDa protein [Cephus cinctus]